MPAHMHPPVFKLGPLQGGCFAVFGVPVHDPGCAALGAGQLLGIVQGKNKGNYVCIHVNPVRMQALISELDASETGVVDGDM